MTEWRLFSGPVPYVSTAGFHRDRERAPHLEQEWHRPRLELAADMVRQAARELGCAERTVTHSDLGCGDGGLLSLLRDAPGLDSWGYDFQPSNAAGWEERDVTAYALDVFGEERDQAEFGEVVSMTEVLEHLADPHGWLKRLRRAGVRRLVCSSPFNENDRVHDECHAWAWDRDGYAAMLWDAGWRIVRNETVNLFQVVLARGA